MESHQHQSPVPVKQSQSHPVRMNSNTGMDPGRGYPVTQPKKEAKESDLSPQQIEEVRKKFNKYDTDGNGTLDKKEMTALLEETLNRKVSEHLLESYVQLQFHATDKNFNGIIEWDEFISLYSKIYIDPDLPIHMGAKPGVIHKVPLETGSHSPKVQKHETAEEFIQHVTPEHLAEAKLKFAKYDTDHSGSINKAELTELLKETMSKKMGEQMVKRYVDAQFQTYDKDNTGQITEANFIVFYEKMFVEHHSPPTKQAVHGHEHHGGVPMPGM